MFDKFLYDRSAFDRSVSLTEISTTISGSGQIEVNFTVKTPVSISLRGYGSLNCIVGRSQYLVQDFIGIGGLAPTPVVSQKLIVATFSGQSILAIALPFTVTFSGEGDLGVSSDTFFYLHIESSKHAIDGIAGMGKLLPEITMKIPFAINEIHGIGGMSTQNTWLLLLKTLIQGQGSISFRRLGPINEKAITLNNIEFRPGQTITIDTNSLQVLFGDQEDVSSVTTDSTFFELNPGDNEIFINVEFKDENLFDINADPERVYDIAEIEILDDAITLTTGTLVLGYYIYAIPVHRNTLYRVSTTIQKLLGIGSDTSPSLAIRDPDTSDGLRWLTGHDDDESYQLAGEFNSGERDMVHLWLYPKGTSYYDVISVKWTNIQLEEVKEVKPDLLDVIAVWENRWL